MTEGARSYKEVADLADYTVGIAYDDRLDKDPGALERMANALDELEITGYLQVRLARCAHRSIPSLQKWIAATSALCRIAQLDTGDRCELCVRLEALSSALGELPLFPDRELEAPEQRGYETCPKRARCWP